MILHKRSFSLYGLSAAIVISGAVLLVSPIVMAAQQTNPSNRSTPANTAADPAKPAAQKPAAKLTDRITDYKAKQAIKLEAAEEAKLKGVCKAAQAKVKTLNETTNSSNTDRTKNYTEITKQLQTINSRLKDAGVTSAELDTAQTKLKELIQKYNDDFAIYKTSLADITELDCVTDPTAFKAALLTARQTRPVLVQDATNIRQHIPTIKQALMMARIQLTTKTPADPTTQQDPDQPTSNSNDGSNSSSNTQGGAR